MAKFITRVELHGVLHDEKPYQVLHEAMEKAGFKRTIQSDSNVTYHLLTAEYYDEGNFTLQNEIDAAKSAAKTTGYPYFVFVAQYTGAMWHNLKKV